MKNILIYILFACLSVSSFAQKPEYREGHYPDGKIRYKGNFVNGKPVGELIRYYPNGKVKAEMNHRGDTVVAVLYGQDESLISSGNYIRQKKDGMWTYRKGERILLQEEYRDDVLNGVSTRFYLSGDIAEKKNWKGGLPDGEWILFYDNGNKRLQVNYTAGQLHGVLRSYDMDGRQTVEGTYVRGLKDGEWKFYDKEGKLDKLRIYRNGKPENAEEEELEESLRIDELVSSVKKIADPATFTDEPELYMRLIEEQLKK